MLQDAVFLPWLRVIQNIKLRWKKGQAYYQRRNEKKKRKFSEQFIFGTYGVYFLLYILIALFLDRF